VLNLQKAFLPLIRQLKWVNASNVTGMTLPVGEDEQYLGIEIKYILHLEYCTGRYFTSSPRHQTMSCMMSCK
jgi:hypothetical protein